MSQVLTFSPNEPLQQCLAVSIVDDAVLEDREVFILQLQTNDSVVIVSPAVSRVEISDDDGEMLLSWCKV